MKDGEKIGGQACLHQGQGRQAHSSVQTERRGKCVSLRVRIKLAKVISFPGFGSFFFFSLHSFTLLFFPPHPFRISIPKSKHPFTPTTSPPITYILTSQHTTTTGRITLKQWETIQKHSPSASESLVSDTHSCSPRSQQRSSSTR